MKDGLEGGDVVDIVDGADEDGEEDEEEDWGAEYHCWILVRLGQFEVGKGCERP